MTSGVTSAPARRQIGERLARERQPIFIEDASVGFSNARISRSQHRIGRGDALICVMKHRRRIAYLVGGAT
jgi:hypothetical protein